MYSTVCRRESVVKVQTVHFRFVALQRRIFYDNVRNLNIYLKTWNKHVYQGQGVCAKKASKRTIRNLRSLINDKCKCKLECHFIFWSLGEYLFQSEFSPVFMSFRYSTRVLIGQFSVPFFTVFYRILYIVCGPLQFLVSRILLYPPHRPKKIEVVCVAKMSGGLRSSFNVK